MAANVNMQTMSWAPSFSTSVQPVISMEYETMKNKPQINGVTLEGNKTNEEILIGAISNVEIEDLLK